MIVQTNNSGAGCEDVKSFEDLVKAMSERARGLYHQEHKGASCLKGVSGGA
jgi:hypothetical protein